MDVIAHSNAAGDVAIGVKIKGAFVPFVTFNRGKIAQMVERGHILQERAEKGDEQAKAVLGDAFKAKAKKGEE